MNKIVFRSLIVVALFSLAACSEKFNVAAPYKNITVIYAFLDRADTAHYIRVQKAFLDQNKSALVMAQTADSSFYAHINVRVDRLSISNQDHVVDTIHLNRVDLDVEGYPKQPGVFFNSPNYAYKFKNNLDPKYIYRVVVTNLVTGQVDSSDAPVIDDKSANVFSIDVIDDTGLNRQGMDFSSTLVNQTFDMNIIYVPPADFNFNGLTSPVYLAYATIRFNWVDSNIVTGEETAHSYDFNLGNKLMPGTSISYNTKDLSLYGAVATGMGKAPQFTARLIDRCDIFCYLTTLDYYNYQQSGLTQGVGLTGNEIEPIYTNVKGPGALGLYTSRGVHSGKITLTLNTVDSLKTNSLLSNANITGTVYH